MIRTNKSHLIVFISVLLTLAALTVMILNFLGIINLSGNAQTVNSDDTSPSDNQISSLAEKSDDKFLFVNDIDDKEAYRLLSEMEIPESYSKNYTVIRYSPLDTDAILRTDISIVKEGSSFTVEISHDGNLIKSYLSDGENVTITDHQTSSVITKALCDEYSPERCASLPVLSEIRQMIFGGEYECSVGIYRREDGNFFRVKYENPALEGQLEDIFFNIENGMVESYTSTYNGTIIYTAKSKP